MNNKGFTMIELLAIITVLATILLISFPTLINMTKRDKEKQYSDVIDTACKAGETFIYSNEELFPELGTEGEVLRIPISSLKEFNLLDKNVENPKTNSELLGKLEFTVQQDKSLKCEYSERESICNLVSDSDSDGKVSMGDKYLCRVNNTNSFNFYVLTNPVNDVLNLIMDRNICEDGTVNYTEDNGYCNYQWETDAENKNGPITAMTSLGNGTRNWNNVPNMNLDYDDIAENSSLGFTTTYGYTGMTITNGVGYITKRNGTTQTPITLTDNKPIKARLPKLTEIVATGCHLYDSSEDYGTCPAWLIENMTYADVSSYAGSGYKDKYSINNNDESYQGSIKGFWTLSSDSIGHSTAYYVFDQGCAQYNLTRMNYFGARPVITVSLSDLTHIS